MKYLIIILLFSMGCGNSSNEIKSLLQTNDLEKLQYTVLNRPSFPDNYHQIEYIGNWVHMNNGGSYAKTINDTARFAFWGYGVQVRTELMEHHKMYQVFINGKFIENVDVQNPVNTTHNLTYSNMNLKTGNHILELIPDGGYFVLNTLTIHYYADPTPDVDPTPEWPCDSTIINWIDSIRWIEKDTIVINYKDSIISHHVYDTITTYIEIDTTQSVKIDTVYILPKEIILKLK